MGWKVTSTSEQLGTGSTGTPVNGVQVFFTTDLGQSGSVFVPNTVVDQGPDTVKAMVAARAGALDAIKGLAG